MCFFIFHGYILMRIELCYFSVPIIVLVRSINSQKLRMFKVIYLQRSWSNLDIHCTCIPAIWQILVCHLLRWIFVPYIYWKKIVIWCSHTNLHSSKKWFKLVEIKISSISNFLQKFEIHKNWVNMNYNNYTLHGSHDVFL